LTTANFGFCECFLFIYISSGDFLEEKPIIGKSKLLFPEKNAIILQNSQGGSIMGFFDFLKPKPAPKIPSEPLIPGAPAVDQYAFRGKSEDYFARLLSGCFSQYEVRTNVQPGTLTQLPDSTWTCVCGNRNHGNFCIECSKLRSEDHYPISFLLCQNGRPVLAILLCDRERANVRRTARACASVGIPCQCYYTHFRNKASYVVDRIRSSLG
jgi:hypothetical protein